MATGPKMNKEQRTALADYAWNKRVEGWSHARIANEFANLYGITVDRSTVTRALNKVDKNAKERITQHAVQAIFEAEAVFDKVVELSFAEFNATPIEGADALGKSPAWLNTIIAATQAKLKALGADVQKIELTGKDGAPVMDGARSSLARLIAAYATANGAGDVAQQPHG